MRDRPTGKTERDLVRALADGWGLSAGTLRYAPVGGGSYHWVVTGARGEQWFVTVDDLDDKGGLGRTRAAVSGGLRAAMDAAVTLRREAGLRFVVAPVPARDGRAVRPLGARHAVAVFPFLRGAPGRWGEPLPAADRAALVAMLRRYAELTGRSVDPAALELYRLRWALDDLSCFVRYLRAPHRRTPGAEHAWQALGRTIASLSAGTTRR